MSKHLPALHDVADPAPTPVLRYLSLDQLVECPDNPRRDYESVGMAQLADSIQRQGVITPLRVRELAAGIHMIAAGHRRYRAAKKAGRTDVPVLIGPMSDAQFYDVLLIENQDRKDLHPLEEARGFELAMKKLGWDVERVAAEIGRSDAHVRERLRLLKLIPDAAKLFAEHAFTLGHANLLATLTNDQQSLAINPKTIGSVYQIGGVFRKELGGGGVAPTLEIKGERLAPVSVAEFRSWIDKHCRFVPEKQIDLPHLMPATAEALQTAELRGTKVVPITRSYMPAESAKDHKLRTYGERAWKRADGHGGSKACEHSVLGVVSSGDGRGEAFQVCIAKEKCSTHWRSEAAAAKRKKRERAAAPATGPAAMPKPLTAAQLKALAKQEREAELENALYEPATLKQVHERVHRALQSAPAVGGTPVADLVLEQCKSWSDRREKVKINVGKTAEDVLRAAAFLTIRQALQDNDLDESGWMLKKVGIDLRAMLDEIVPATADKGKKRAAA